MFLFQVVYQLFLLSRYKNVKIFVCVSAAPMLRCVNKQMFAIVVFFCQYYTSYTQCPECCTVLSSYRFTIN